MKLQIKTLSPLHIGNGEKYNGLSYLQDKRQSPTKLCYLEFDLLQKMLNHQQLQNFGDWVVTERFPNLYKFLRNIVNDRNNSIANNLISKSLYKVDLLYKEDPQQRKFLGDIESFIKQNNKPYIPGTEIKGAIRTAILYALLNQESSLWDKESRLFADEKANKLIESIRDFGNRNRTNILRAGNKRLDRHMRDEKKIKEKILVEQMKEIQKQLQVKLLHANNNNDAKYDLLKLLHIGDTELKKPSDSLFVSNLEVKGINRGFPLFQELCKKDQTFTCQGFKLDNNKTILDRLGFNNEQKRVVSDIKNIFKCCYEFTNKLIDEELAYQQYPQKIKDKLTAIKDVNKPDSPVIRIGKNEGYLSLTMGLLVKDKDKALYDNVLCHATKNTSYTGIFPKTRRAVNLGNGDVDTCGWVKLEAIS